MQTAEKARHRRKSLQLATMLGALFLLVVLVFGILFGAGYFIAGS